MDGKEEGPSIDHGDGDVTKDERPAGIKEWITRLGVAGNVGIQGINIALNATKSWDGLPMVRIVERSCSLISSGLAIANSPVVVHRERQLTREDTFRAALNGVREQATYLSVQNDILESEIDDLQSDVDRLRETEMALNSLAETQGTQLTRLMGLIEENKEINAGIRSVLEKRVIEDVISLVLDIDADGSFKIEHKEIDRLIVGMTLIEGITKFDKQIFREEIENCDARVELVIALIKSMLSSSGKGGGGGCTRCCIELEDPESYLRKQSSKLSGSSQQ
ncbi:hypothetical protein ACHAXA_000227 [Cyclostephanos tholiformis]|uniref:Uncharacterized protein n=1 Tax=Cyclostephanos tholiformis TaxID=382380 RepID=A0ABD3RAJ5_9STRA